MSNVKEKKDVDYAEQAVPEEGRKGFVTMFMIMLGFTFFSASMWVGQEMAAGLDFWGFIKALLLGGAILGIYTGLLGYVGAETGLSLDLLSKRAFGEKGSYISSALTSFTQIGWFGVGIAMFAIPVARELFGGSTAVEWVLILIAGACMTASAYFGYDEFGIGLYDSDKQEYHPCLEENGPYLTALKFYNTLYQKGLLDPDSQTQGYDGMVEDYQNGTAFLNVFNFLGSSLYNSEAHTAEGKMMAPCPPSEAEPIAYGQNIYGGNRPWTIGANTEYPELCMAIINWLATPEGRMTLEYGPKDVCWYYDEDGNTCFTDLGKSAKLDGKTEMSDGYSGTFEDGNFKINNTTWALDTTNLDSKVGETYNYKRWSSFNSAAGSEIEQDWRDHNNCELFDDYFKNVNLHIAPGTMYSAGVRSDELQLVWTQVTTCIKEGSWKAIYASSDEEFDKIVADMVAQANEYGYDQCVEFQQNEVTLRAAAEDAARAGEVVE